MIWHWVQKVELLVYLSAANITATTLRIMIPNAAPMIVNLFFMTANRPPYPIDPSNTLYNSLVFMPVFLFHAPLQQAPPSA